MKKFFVSCLLLLVAMTFLTAGCGGGEKSKKAAVSFANSSASWQRNGETIKKTLEDEGFAVELAFANSAGEQNVHIEQMLAGNPGCLVIGAVDSAALAKTLEKAKEQNVPVIAYDRLIMGSDAVSYYASFDNEAIGEAMGEYIEAALNLKSGAGSFNIEIFAGDPADNNAHLFFDGAMKILRPYFDTGQLVCPSGETAFDVVATKDWEPKNAEARMDKILAAHYADGAQLHAVLAPNDGTAGAIIASLEKNGTANMPIITGQDADAAALENIQAGKQSMTIFKNPAELTAKCVRMIKAVIDGTQPDINDVSTYNNGVVVVPAYLCVPYIVDKDNIGIVK